MRRLVAGGVLVMVVAGCARLGTPNAPMVMTAEGRRCVRQCQALHDRCVRKVDRAIGEDYLRFANPRLGACNNHLGDCYTTCPN